MKSIMQYFKKHENTFIFTGKKMIVKIPRRYENYSLLSVQEDVKTLAIFEIVIDDKVQHGFLLPALIAMKPSRTYKMVENDQDILIAEFQTGDIFMTDRVVLRRSRITYNMFVEFLGLGNLPKFMDYESTAFMFDKAAQICDANLRTNHAIFEMIYAHLFRDPDDLNIKYRNSTMKKNPAFVGLNSVTYGTDSTTTKLIGAYMSDGTNAAIVNQATERSEIEDLLRT